MLPPRIGPGRPRATWRSDLKRVRTPSFLLLSALLLAACSQSKGDPCQVTSDCGSGSGLLCCPAADTPRGVCIEATSCPDQVIDAGSPDASEPNDGEDSGAS